MPTHAPPSTIRHSPETILVAFGHALRAAGLPVTTAATRSFVAALAHLDLASRSDVYWAGRATLCSSAGDLAGYDRVFTAWFERELPPTAKPRPDQVSRQAAVGPGEEDDGAASVLATLASSAEQLRHRDVAELDPAERAWLNRAIRALPVPRPMRRTRRTAPFHHGQVDRVRTLRADLRRAGEPGPLHYARARRRPRRLVLLIDVSGSMRPYADTLLRLAHHIARSGDVEVFTLGTRLTRLTQALQHGDADVALQRAGAAIPDWSGGTRLADTLGAFVQRWGRRGMARGAVVLIASDGWERGDPAQLGEQLRRLGGLARRIVWSNPHAGKAGYQPVQGGIVAALPHLDALVAGHSLAAFEQVLAELGADRTRPGRSVKETAIDA